MTYKKSTTTKQTVTVSDAYTTFKSHQDRQKQVLNSVLTEQRDLLLQFKNVLESFPTLLQNVFPTIADLPLNLMTEASALKEGGIKRDFTHLLAALQRKDETNRKQLSDYETQNGTISEVKEKKGQLETEIKTVEKEMQATNNELELINDRRDDLQNKLSPLTDYKNRTGREFTIEMANTYSKRSVIKWLTDSSWRSARATLLAYQENGGTDINADRADLTDAKSRSAELRDIHAEITGKARELRSKHSDVSAVITGMEKLEKEYKGTDKIHAEICVNFADYLQSEAVATFIGKNLPAAQAKPLMEATLKFKNLGIMHDNLETLRKSAEKALGQFDKPVSDLYTAQYRKPYRTIELDMGPIDTTLQNLQKFNDHAKTSVARSAAARKTANKFSTSNHSSAFSSSSSGYYTSAQTSSYDSDPFAFWRTMYYIEAMNNSSANPDCRMEHANIDLSQINDATGDIGSLNIEVPSMLADMPAIDLSTIDLSNAFSCVEFDGGSYSGGGGGGYESSCGGSCGGGGGGGDISANINIPAIEGGIKKFKRTRGRNFAL